MSANAGTPGTTHLLWRVVTRFWSARALAEAGVDTTALVALLAGPPTLLVIGAACFHSLTWAMSEPYPDLTPMIPTLHELLIATCVASVVVGVFLLLPAAVFALTSPRDYPETRHTKRAPARIVLLLPLCAVVPMLAWLPMSFLSSVASPSVDINSGKPAWTTWVGWRVAGSCFWLPLFVGLAVWHVCRAIAIADRHFRGERCIGCGYALAGLDAPVCPECGKAAAA